VSLTAKGPDPATVTVEWGDTVVFTNADSIERAVTSAGAPFASGPIPPGGTFEFHFDGRARRYGFVQTGSRPNTSGTVEVKASGKVTLAAVPGRAVYGSNVTLSGRSSYPGTPVVVQFRPAGGTGDWQDVLSLVASDTGAYTGRIKALAGGLLRARVAAGQVSSGFVDLELLPRLRAGVQPRRAPAGTRVAVTGAIVPAGAASTADLETYDTERKVWVREASRRFSRTGKVAFALKIAKGRTRVRLALRRSVLAPGFAPVVSNVVSVVGTSG
jgi:plastocyanin